MELDMGGSFWRNLPLFKQMAMNNLLLKTHAVLNEIYKVTQNTKELKDLHKSILPLLMELGYSLKDEIYILSHERGKQDAWNDVLHSGSLKIKNTGKLEIFLDHERALKIKDAAKYFSNALPIQAKGGIAVKLSHHYDYLFLYRVENDFVKVFFDIVFNVFAAISHFLASGEENARLKEQIELLKKQIMEVNDQLAEAEKNLKRRLHEIDQLFQVSNELFGMVERENLINTALLIIVGQLGADSTFALLLNPETNTYSDFFSKGFGIEQQTFSLEKDHPLVKYFRDGGDILHFEEIQLDSSKADILPFFTETKAQMVAPLIVDGDLIGILGCGEKLFGGAYDAIDKRIFKVLMNTITIAFKNLFIYEKVSEESLVDKNTGLPNRKYFESRIEEEKSRAKRQKSTLGLFLIMPDTKDVFLSALEQNDLQSLERKMAQKLKGVVRKQDFLALVEPATFALISPGIQEENMYAVVERIKNALEPFSVEESTFQTKELNFEIERYLYPDKEVEFDDRLQLLIKSKEDGTEGDESEFLDLDFNI
jgi:GGDEF domain-containing protein